MDRGPLVSPAAILPWALVALSALGGARLDADVVLDWNEQLLDAIREARIDPPMASRHIALTNVAIFDAINGITGDYAPYLVSETTPEGASPEAAGAAAGHAVLVALYPERRPGLDAALAEMLAGIPESVEKSRGVEWGTDCAASILTVRSTDGSAAETVYAPPLGANWWIRTPPAFATPLRPQWPRVEPWAMRNGAQFRAPGPPRTMSDPVYTSAFDEVKRLGGVSGSERTADQTEIAWFWEHGPGTATPPGHWLMIARVLADEAGHSVVENARLFALLSIALADAAIVAWDSKYFFHHWRPYTAIVNADIDGNARTAVDPDWQNLLPTPPFPTYTSGHSTFGAAGARLLARFFGSDELPFSVGSDDLPGVVRSFTSLSQAAEENGQSRIYGGIHWQYDNRDALAAGRALADFVWENQLRPADEEASECEPTDAVLCLLDGRFSVEVDWRTSAESSPDTVGGAHAEPLTESSGQFWFFRQDNVELLVKVLDGCATNGHFWVLGSGATHVELILRVRDHEAGETRTYFNPLGHFGAAIADTAAFPCG